MPRHLDPSDAARIGEPHAVTAAIGLLDMPLHHDGYVLGVAAASSDEADLAVRLGELGCLPGEPIRVIAKAAFGGPLAVRVAGATFALRRSEAASVRVTMGQHSATPVASQ